MHAFMCKRDVRKRSEMTMQRVGKHGGRIAGKGACPKNKYLVVVVTYTNR